MPFIVDSGGAAAAADRRRFVTIAYDGTITTVLDVETGAGYQSVRDSTKITPGQRKPTMARSQRRYGGSRQTGETHDNGSFAWKMLIKGATADACLANTEALLTVIESATSELYFEWRPAGATFSTYYELRGIPVWTPTYEWAQFYGAQSMYMDVQVPVAPLCLFASSTITIGSTVVPAVVALASPVGGNAPALADIALTTSGGSAAPIWALLGWTKRPGSPLASSVAPFGVIAAETGTGLSGWAVTSDVDYRGSSGLQVTAAGAGSASASYTIDPSVMTPDDFARGEIAVEVWARAEIASTLVSPKVFLDVEPFAGTTFGAAQYSAEFGTAGKSLVLPSSGLRFRPVKLGTVNLPINTGQPLKHTIKVQASWAVGSTGVLGLDELVLVPARQRALSPSSKANDATFPKFIASTSATTKTIASDLSGTVASGAGNPGRDSGLGGSMIELPPGNVDLLVALYSTVPDDPTSDASSAIASHSVTGTVRVTPRGWLARAA